MAHFARIDENNIVVEVLVVPNEQEHRGQEFLAVDLGLEGTWIQTSYNNKFRKQYAGPDFTYDPVADVFVAPQPYPSWALDANHDWVAPKPKPNVFSTWDEGTLSWVQPHHG